MVLTRIDHVYLKLQRNLRVDETTVTQFVDVTVGHCQWHRRDCLYIMLWSESESDRDRTYATWQAATDDTSQSHFSCQW